MWWPLPHPLTAINCGTISPWPDSPWSPQTPVVSPPDTPALSCLLPIQPLQWCQSGHSEHVDLFVTFLCFLSMADIPPWCHPLLLLPSSHFPSSNGCVLHVTLHIHCVPSHHTLLQFAFPHVILWGFCSVSSYSTFKSHIFKSLLCEDTLMGSPSRPPPTLASSIQAFSQHFMQN